MAAKNFAPPIGARLNKQAGINNGVVGCWLLNEGGGQVFTDLAGANQGIGINGPEATQTMYGNAVKFTRASTQAINCGVDLGQGGRNSGMAVSLWFYHITNENMTLFHIGNSTHVSGGDGFAFGVGNTYLENAGNNLIILWNGVRWISSGIAVSEGIHHIVVNIETTGTLQVWLDGKYVIGNAGTAMAAIGSKGTSEVRIGGYVAGAASRYTTGSIWNVRFYRRPLGILYGYAEAHYLFQQPFIGLVMPPRIAREGPATTEEEFVPRVIFM